MQRERTPPLPARAQAILNRLSGRPRVLADPVLDARLARDGFVRLPVLSPSGAAELREAFGTLHGWEGDGFEVDFWSPDPGYRREASELIAGHVDAALAAAFVDHEAFLRNFLVKWPGHRDPGGFPEAAHRDWMYTDERAGVRSYVAWIPLQDVLGDNGQLLVARGSHRIEAGIRGTNIDAPWLGHTDVWDERLLAVPVRAGEAIVTDAATVHGSFSNLSDEPRVVAAVAVRPAGAQLVHFRNLDGHRAARFDVDPSFFLEQSAEALLREPPDRPIAEVVDIDGEELSPAELAERLDRQPLVRRDRRHRQRAGALVR
ncbi:MAG: phytanoyl-CoA dioxygenase family protein [Acidimicrobiales bacterium]